MTTEAFNRILDEQIDICKAVLCKKAEEYATEDRLHNFRIAAALQGITPEQALAGMMAKHTVCVYDMVQSRKQYPLEMWDEKCTDSINYILLLRALVEEQHKGGDSDDQQRT